LCSREVYGSAPAPESDDDALSDAAEPDASSRRRFRVNAEHAGERLDKLLATWMPEISRSRLKQWIEDGAVRVNQSTVRPRHAVLAGDVIELEPQPAPDAAAFAPEPMALSIVHQDDAIIVIDKPSGMAAHTGSGITGGTVVDVVRGRCQPGGSRKDEQRHQRLQAAAARPDQ